MEINDIFSYKPDGKPNEIDRLLKYFAEARVYFQQPRILHRLINRANDTIHFTKMEVPTIHGWRFHEFYGYATVQATSHNELSIIYVIAATYVKMWDGEEMRSIVPIFKQSRTYVPDASKFKETWPQEMQEFLEVIQTEFLMMQAFGIELQLKHYINQTGKTVLEGRFITVKGFLNNAIRPDHKKPVAKKD